MFYLCDMSLVPYEKAERRGGKLFCPIFRNHYFTLELQFGDQLCSKCTNKSFVSYSVNEI